MSGISPDSPGFFSAVRGCKNVRGLRILLMVRFFFLILDLFARHRVFKHSLTAVHLSADLAASADVATGLATTFYLVIWQHNRGNVFMLFSCVK
jgi:hypothetical protein